MSLPVSVPAWGRPPFEFNPLSLFASGEQGAWYDPSDFQAGWRRNLLTYTEQFDNAAWTKAAATITSTSVVDPLGGSTAETIAIASGGRVVQAVSGVIANTNYTLSAWVKKSSIGGATAIRLTTTNTLAYNTGFSQKFTLTSEWVRISATGVITSGTSINNLFGSLDVAGNIDTDCIGNVDIWGAQLEVGSTATTYQRIVTPEITYVADVQPQPILYQDSAGTTPVTAVEQPVGLMLDKSQGLTLGNNIVAGYDFTTWTTAGAVSSVTVNSFITTGVGGIIFGGSTLTVGKTYKIIISGTTTATKVNVRNTTNLTNSASATTGNFNITMNVVWAISPSIYLQNESAGTTTITSFTVQEIFGNHAFQGTTTPNDKRPILSARVNLLTKTEQLNDAAWDKAQGGTGTAPVVTSNYALAPDGTMTATRIQADRGIGTVTGADYSLLRQNIGTVGTYDKKYTFWVKSNTGLNQTFVTNYSSTLSSIATNEWQQITVNFSGLADYFFGFGVNGTRSDQAIDILVWHPDLRPANIGNNIPAYQRVNTATDYDTAGFPLYLKADGSFTSMSTNSIDFSATYKMTVVYGYRQNTTGNRVLQEMSVQYDVNQGSFILYTSYSGLRAGSTYLEASVGITPPASFVRTSLFDGSLNTNTKNIYRQNGVLQTPSYVGSPAGTSNFGNYPLYLFARNNASSFFNGYFYGAIIRGATTSGADLTNAESYMNKKAGGLY